MVDGLESTERTGKILNDEAISFEELIDGREPDPIPLGQHVEVISGQAVSGTHRRYRINECNVPPSPVSSTSEMASDANEPTRLETEKNDEIEDALAEHYDERSPNAGPLETKIVIVHFDTVVAAVVYKRSPLTLYIYSSNGNKLFWVC